MGRIPKILLLILILWGIIFELSFIFSFEKIYPEECEFECIAEIVSLKKEKENSNSYDIKILSSNIDKSQNTKIILYTKKNIELKYGDIIKVSGNFSKADKATNYKGFDYRNYLKQKKIYGSIYAQKCEKINHKNSITEKIFNLKEKLLQSIDNLYENNDVSSFLKGILIGDSSEISDEIEENFRNSSMSHVLAISGMHVSYVIIGMQAILDKIINSRKTKNIILICMLCFFAIITGGSQSCVRACIMNILLLISQNLYKKNSFYVSFIFTFLILILMNPFNIFSVGMWLSFGGTLGIILFHNFISRFLICKLKIKSQFLKKFLDIFLVSFSAQILIFPIMIYNFNTISLTFFVTNLLIYFIIGPILAIGYISVILGIFIYPFGKILAIFENFLVVIILKIAELCSKLPFSKIYFGTPNFFALVLYYAIITFFILWFNKNKFKFFKFILKNETSEFLKKNSQKILSIVLIFLLIFNLYKFIPHNLKIYFVDVGQGDCSIIQTPYGKNIIIDGGNNQDYDYGKNVVLPYLLDRGITKIDYLIVSHFDSDHCGGLFTIVEELKVKKIVIGKQESLYENCEKFLKLAAEKKIDVMIVKAGDTINLDKKTYFQILSPDAKNLFDDSKNGINNNSIVAKLCYQKFSAIFTGDIEEISEKKLIEKYGSTGILNCDLLKVAHHGSKSSSIQEIINLYSPNVSVIEVGKDNSYGHPNGDVIERLEDCGSSIYRTDENGEIDVIVYKNGKIKCKNYVK